MTNLLARILLSIMLLPLAAAVYLVVLFALVHGFASDEVAFLVATLVTATFVVIYWLRLWRESVSWTPKRIRQTVLSGVGSIFAGIVVAVVLTGLSGIHDAEFGFFIGGLVSMVCWVPITVVIWKETPLERANRLRQAATDVLFCPRCGYNMTGLREARCPECGAQFTLNQLYAAQQRQEIADAAAPHEDHA